MVVTWSEAFETQRNTIVSFLHPDEHHVIAEVHQEAVGAGSGVPVEMTSTTCSRSATAGQCACTCTPTAKRRSAPCADRAPAGESVVTGAQAE